jgi:pantoate--beta-alanine ligase
MGALHRGHLSLVERGLEHGQVVVSIFVNPTQFGPGEDYASYPRELERDLEALNPFPVAAVFAPEASEMYGDTPGVMVQPGRRAAGLCGGRRPGHFAGVLTVVAKLFLMIRPDAAVFGQKDAQQLLVIDEMVRDLAFPVRLVGGATVREADGLAMSSRNAYLTGADRERANCLYRSLQAAYDLLREGIRQQARIQAAMLEVLGTADSVEYAEIRALPDLDPLESVTGRVLLAVAAEVGPARLIDNLVLTIRQGEVSKSPLLQAEGAER